MALGPAAAPAADLNHYHSMTAMRHPIVTVHGQARFIYVVALL